MPHHQQPHSYTYLGVPPSLQSGVGLCGTPVGRCCAPRLAACTYYPSRRGSRSPIKKPNSLGFFLLLLTWFASIHTSILYAQSQNDFRAQAYLAVSKQLSPSWNVHCLLTSGLHQNASEIQYIFGELGADYKLNTNWSVGANYRRSKVRNLDNFFDDRQIASVEANFSKTKNNLTFAWRTRLQTQWYGASFTENFRPNRHYLRNKLALRYPLSYYWRPYVSIEPFVRLNSSSLLLDNLRYAGGMQYRINEIWKLDGFVQINQQLNRSRNTSNLSIGLGLSCAL